LKAGDKSGEKKNQSQKKPALAGVGGIGKRSEAGLIRPRQPSAIFHLLAYTGEVTETISEKVKIFENFAT
jgi:hypothetical protein